MTNAYRDEALRVARISLSNWNRDPASPSCGCFDRSYWGWKKKDLPDATFQVGIRPVLRMAEAEGRVESLRAMIEPYIRFTESIQHGYGSFDQMYPHERAPGVVHDILSTLVWLWQSPYPNTGQKERLERIMQRGVHYALTADEKHGEIANHFAQYAWELINYGHAFGHAAAAERGRMYVERTLALFNSGEGWFLEYDGADAGYQTRCLNFLARIAELTGDEALWSTLRQAMGFFDRLVMPDGSLHPMLGVRSTALTYVSGFERVAARYPEFAATAERVHAGWLAARTPLPGSIDFENGLRIGDDAWDAAELRETRLAGQKAQENSEGGRAWAANFDLPDAGISRRARRSAGRRRATYVAPRLGGPVVVYDQPEAEPARLAYEDSGYLLRLADGSRWVMRHAGSGSDIRLSENEISLAASFTRALHEDMTPFQMIVLRTLNLTVLRSQWIGDLFKKLVVRRLISGKATLGVACHRRITFGDGKVTIEDRFDVPTRLGARLRGARLFRCRRTIANHMASSRYFQPQELECDQPWEEELPVESLDGRLISRTID